MIYDHIAYLIRLIRAVWLSTDDIEIMEASIVCGGDDAYGSTDVGEWYVHVVVRTSFYFHIESQSDVINIMLILLSFSFCDKQTINDFEYPG